MELRGVLAALEYFKTPTKMKIYSDSQYVVSSIVNGHAKK
jgi:ribonuclease HI